MLSDDKTTFFNWESIIFQPGCMGSTCIRWIQTSPCLSLYAYTFFFTIHKSPFIFLLLSLHAVSHHVILLPVCMSILLHLSFSPTFAILPFSPPRTAGESPVNAAAVPPVDVVGSWTGMSDVKESSPFCLTGLSLNYWCKYVAKTSLMQAVTLKWKHDMSIKCDLCVIIIHMPSDRGEKWLAN